MVTTTVLQEPVQTLLDSVTLDMSLSRCWLQFPHQFNGGDDNNKTTSSDSQFWVPGSTHVPTCLGLPHRPWASVSLSIEWVGWTECSLKDFSHLNAPAHKPKRARQKQGHISGPGFWEGRTMPGLLPSPHWLFLRGAPGNGQGIPGSSFSHSVNTDLPTGCQLQCWGYSSEQHHCGLCLLQKCPTPVSVLREGDGNTCLLSAYYVSDALLGVFLKFPDHGRPKRLH